MKNLVKEAALLKKYLTGEATPEEASTLVVEQDVVPRDGAYEMTSSNTKVHMGEPYSDDVREDIYAQGDVVPNARYVNSDWMLITEGTDSMYVERKYMRKLRLYELVRRYGEDSPIVAAERECIERAPGLTVFNDGLKAGLYGSWLIVAMAVVMAVITYIVFVHKDKVKVLPSGLQSKNAAILGASALVWQNA